MSKKYLTDKELEEILARSDDSDQEYEPLSSDDELSDTENLQNPHESVADIQSYILDISQRSLDVIEIESSSSIEHGRFDWSTEEFSPDVYEFDESSSGCKIQVTKINRQYQFPKLQSIDRITNLPVVESGCQYVGSFYNRIKNSNNVVHWAIGQAEATLTIVVDSALPAAVLLEGPLQVMDKALCYSLDVVEQKVPYVKDSPETIYVNAKQYVSDMGSRIVQPVLKRADSVKQLGNTVLASKYTELAAETLDGALDVADKYVEKYLPGDQSESKDLKPESDSSAGKAMQTIHHVDRFSRKLQRRLTQRAIAEAEAIKEQSTEAIHVLFYIAELIATDPALALEKGKELWAYLSQDEPENQARPENLEQLVVLLTRESARRVVHLVNFTFDELNKVPNHVSNILHKIFRKQMSVAEAVTSTLHLENLSDVILGTAEQRVRQLAVLLQQTNSFMTNLLEQLAKTLADLESNNKRRIQESRQSNASNFDTLKPPTPNTQLRASVANGIE